LPYTTAYQALGITPATCIQESVFDFPFDEVVSMSTAQTKNFLSSKSANALVRTGGAPEMRNFSELSLSFAKSGFPAE